MYGIAEKNLADLLSRQPYPQLMNAQFTYWGSTGQKQTITYNSLLKGNQPDVALCQQAAAAVIKDLAKSGGVKEFGSRQPVRVEL